MSRSYSGVKFRSQRNREHTTTSDSTSFRPYTQIRRLVSLQSLLGSEWEESLSQFSQGNRAFKRIQSEKLGLTFVEDENLGRILNRKFPNYGNDRRQTRDIQQRLAGSLRHFVSQSFELEKLKSGGTPPVRFSPHEPIAGADPEEPTKWNHLQAVTNPYYILLGKKAVIAVDLSKNEELFEERQEILTFLRTEHRLDMRHVTREYRPHVSVFRVRDPQSPSPRAIHQSSPFPGAMLLSPPVVTHDIR